jgi:hypothetical protein
MNGKLWRTGILLSLLPAALWVLGGCNNKEASPKGGQEKGERTQVDSDQPSPPGKKGHDHGGWWCDEHGVPEEICGRCNAKYAAECQKKGDWCKKHDRPDSQCFLCHPEKEAEFAAKYEDKYGKKPPKPQEEAPKKGEGKQ